MRFFFTWLLGRSAILTSKVRLAHLTAPCWVGLTRQPVHLPIPKTCRPQIVEPPSHILLWGFFYGIRQMNASTPSWTMVGRS